MKKLAIGLTVLVVLIVGGLLVLPFFLPIDKYKGELTKHASEATGRDLTIEGPLKLSLLPRVEIAAGDVALANAPGGRNEKMVTLDRLLVRVDPWTYLFSQEIAIDSFVLVEPVIHLEVDEKGAANWNLAAGQKPEAEESQAEKAPEGQPGETEGGPPLDLAGLRLDDVRIEGGLLTYDNAMTGESHEISNINTKLSLAALDQPLAVEGAATWNAEEIGLSLAADNLRSFFDGKAMTVKLDLRGKPLTLAFQGDVTAGAALGVGGQLDLDVPSVRDLAAWTGNPIEQGGTGLGPLAIGGRVVVAGSTYEFQDATIKLDDMTAKGGLKADLGGAKPYLGGTLSVDLLDVNPYLPEPAEAKGEGKASQETKKAKAEGPTEWSDEPIDLSALKALNADFDLSVGGIRFQEIKVGESALTVSLKDGRLVTDLTKLALYDGSGTGRIMVDASGDIPAIEESFDLKGVALEPLLTDAAGFDSLEGTGAFDISVTTKGRSQREMVKALNGGGAFKFVDGAVKGINLAAMARNLETAFLGNQEEQKTDFAELSGTVKITQGILRNEDLKLLNPLIRVKGRGSSDLPAKTVDYRIKTKAVADLKGQGGDAEKSGVAVAIIAEGPWHDITYRPDLADLAKEQGLKKAGKGLKDAAKGLGSNLDGGEDSGKDLKDNLKDAGKSLKKLFGD